MLNNTKLKNFLLLCINRFKLDILESLNRADNMKPSYQSMIFIYEILYKYETFTIQFMQVHALNIAKL